MKKLGCFPELPHPSDEEQSENSSLKDQVLTRCTCARARIRKRTVVLWQKVSFLEAICVNMAPSRHVQHLIPLLILVPYCAYVLSDRFTDHNERKAENAAKKQQDRERHLVKQIEKEKEKTAGKST